MSHPFGTRRHNRIIPAIIIGTGAFYAKEAFGPVMAGPEVNWPSAIAASFLGLSVLAGVTDSLRCIADGLDRIGAFIPSDLHGTAGFVKSLREVKHDLLSHGWGPYWGTFKGKPVFADFESSSYTLGPSGSGKSTKVVHTMALALRGRSKTIIDFKSELTPVLADALRQQDDCVKIINLGGLYTERVGASECYNVLSPVIKLFSIQGGLRDIQETVAELCLQLEIEPEGDGSKGEPYWRDGTRDLLLVVIIFIVLLHGPQAHFGHVCQLVNDRAGLTENLLWAAGKLEGAPAMPLEDSPWATCGIHDEEEITSFIAWFRTKASALASLLETMDSKAAEGFLSAAQLDMAPFSITSRAARVTQTSSFSFAQQKEGKKPTTVFIMLDAHKAKAQSKVLGLILWGMLYEIKQHPNKNRPVHLLADEATNIPWSGLGSLMTWSRGYGLRLHFIFQTFAAFEAAHGKHTLQILLSECEIAQIMPAQRNPETLRLIESMLAERTQVVRNRNHNRDTGVGIDSTSYSEAGRSLMTADEIRRCKQGILFIRQNKPMLIDLPSIAEIHPWRTQVGINPFHGKPYLKRIKQRIGSRKGFIVLRPLRWLKHCIKGGLS